jgi:hypothetical protein
MWGENINTVKTLETSREVGIEVNTEKTKYKFMSRPQNAGQTHNSLTGNNFFENVVKFNYLGTVTRHLCIHEEIRSRLNLMNVCHHSAQTVLSSCLLIT